jgi:hypothetical protein
MFSPVELRTLSPIKRELRIALLLIVMNVGALEAGGVLWA